MLTCLRSIDWLDKAEKKTLDGILYHGCGGLSMDEIAQKWPSTSPFPRFRVQRHLEQCVAGRIFHGLKLAPSIHSRPYRECLAIPPRAVVTLTTKYRLTPFERQQVGMVLDHEAASW